VTVRPHSTPARNRSRRRAGRPFLWCTLILAASLFAACSPASPQEVVVYASVDRHYAEPVLQRFELMSGITVKAAYDIEAAKTTGMVNRLIAERDQPLADVFWNGEFVQTLLLQQRRVLAPYQSPNASEIPAGFKDPDAYWTAFGGRARVILVNTERLTPPAYPRSLFDFVDESRDGSRLGIALPLFGTTATHAAALYALLGPERARRYFETLKRRGVRVLDGNARVRDEVVAGHIGAGLTDTDDACAALAKGSKVAIVVPDQEPGGIGTLVIPNTVALIAGAPHAETGRRLIDYLLSEEVARDLAQRGWFHALLRPLSTARDCRLPVEIATFKIRLADVFAQLDTAKRELRGIFLQ
jgi:iron(III) transport system substrate-binding protein